MPRPRVQPIALLLTAGTALGAGILVITILASRGQGPFFDRGDERMFWLTARDLFGTGHGFAALGRAAEIPYRYGRVGLPLLAWLLALGRPGHVGITLIIVNAAAVAAIPGLAATLLDDYGAPAFAGVAVLLAPGLPVLIGNVVSEPLLIALILFAYLLDERAHRGAARCVLAYAILVKEIAVLALIPWLWRAIRARDHAAVVRLAGATVPYAAWCAWLRWRVGEVPFLSHAARTSQTLSAPFVGIHDTIAAHTPDAKFTVTMVLVTALLGAIAAWLARPNQLGALAGIFAVLTLCLGIEALRFEGETFRVLVVPQVFALVALTLAVGTRDRGHQARDARRASLDTD